MILSGHFLYMDIRSAGCEVRIRVRRPQLAGHPENPERREGLFSPEGVPLGRPLRAL